MLFSTIADLGITGLQAAFAILTGSMTMLSEAIRSALMLAVEFYSLWLLGGIHRGRLHHFQFGVGKIEQFVWLIIGLALVLSGAWIAGKVLEALFVVQIVPAPLGLACVAVVNAINFLINGFSLYAMIACSKHDDSEIYAAQIRSRALKAANSAFLQVTLTIAALTSDPVIALIMDGVGATFVACLMVVTGTSMVSRSMPNLLDAPIAQALHERIVAAVADTTAKKDQVVQIRTRRSGQYPHVEIAIRADASRTVSDLKKLVRDVREAVRRFDSNISLTMVIADDSAS